MVRWTSSSGFQKKKVLFFLYDLLRIKKKFWIPLLEPKSVGFVGWIKTVEAQAILVSKQGKLCDLTSLRSWLRDSSLDSWNLESRSHVAVQEVFGFGIGSEKGYEGWTRVRFEMSRGALFVSRLLARERRRRRKTRRNHIFFFIDDEDDDAWMVRMADVSIGYKKKTGDGTTHGYTCIFWIALGHGRHAVEKQSDRMVKPHLSFERCGQVQLEDGRHETDHFFRGVFHRWTHCDVCFDA